MLALLVGTLMPGYMRDAMQDSLVPPAVPLSAMGHILCFFLMAGAIRVSALRLKNWQIAMAAVMLGALTEGMQHFAVERHPRLLDVVYDLSGALLGLFVIRLADKRTEP